MTCFKKKLGLKDKEIKTINEICRVHHLTAGKLLFITVKKDTEVRFSGLNL
jgi:hypothetical protein